MPLERKVPINHDYHFKLQIDNFFLMAEISELTDVWTNNDAVQTRLPHNMLFVTPKNFHIVFPMYI